MSYFKRHNESLRVEFTYLDLLKKNDQLVLCICALRLLDLCNFDAVVAFKVSVVLCGRDGRLNSEVGLAHCRLRILGC